MPAPPQPFNPTSYRPPGSVSLRGTRYLAQQPPSMGRKSKVFDTVAEAWTWLAQAHVLGGGDDAAAARMSLHDALLLWLESLNGHTKATTRQGYRSTLQRTLAHPLAQTPLGEVGPLLLETLLNAVPANHVRVKTADRLRNFFQWAAAKDLIIRDPWVRSDCELIRKYTKKIAPRISTTGKAWTLAETRTALARTRPGAPFRALVAFLLVTGGRRGEALGLAWDTIDGHTARFARNVTRCGGKVFIEALPKTHEARTAFYGPRMALLLRSIAPASPGDFVFPGKGGGPRHPEAVSAEVAALARRAGVPRIGCTHGLRRTFATVLDSEGCPPSVREALLGHLSDRYAVAYEAEMRKWAERADELFLQGIVDI